MKTKVLQKIAVLCVALLGFSGIGFSQCAASFFGSTGTGGGVLFDNNSTVSTTNGNIFYWTFSGGTPSQATTNSVNDSVYVSYSSPGTYTVCLALIDTVNNCTDSICDTIVITSTGNPYASISTINSSCGQCNGSASASATGGSAPYTYMWSSGSTTSSISGLCNGTYTVTVTDNNGVTATSQANIFSMGGVSASLPGSVYACDSTTVVCVTGSGGAAPYSFIWSNGAQGQCIYPNSSGNYTVTVSDANGCTDVATTSVTNYPAITISASSTDETCAGCCDGSATVSASGGTGAGFTYAWSNSATTASLSGLCTGSLWVTVTDDSSGCTQSAYVSISNPCQNTIAGTITPMNEPSTAYLIQESGGVLSLVDSFNVDSGMYWFANVCAGTYYVKAALRTSSAQYAYFLPTYYVQDALWGTATSVVPSGNTNGIDISLLTGTNLGGPGFIGGLISQGANRAEGDPVVGADVFLMDANDNVLASTRSNAQGEYSFDDLPVGDYLVMVDMLNFEPYPHAVSVTEEEAQFDTKNFVVEGGTVRPVAETGVGIGQLAQGEAIAVYPNPAKDVIFVEGENIATVSVFNLLGTQVESVAGSNAARMEVSLSDLAPGQYILKIESNNGQMHYAPVVKQ